MKINIKIQITLLLVFVQLLGCSNKNIIEPKHFDKTDISYKNAVIDSMIAEKDEISNRLIDINEKNNSTYWKEINGHKYVLTVTWTKDINNYRKNKTIKTFWGDTWVTIVPEIQNWFSNNYKNEKLNLRTEQLLGLPKNSGYSHFIELWVRPDNLFRPSPDNEIWDKSAQLEFPKNTKKSYKNWFNKNFISSYYSSKRYPWTRLGYTYDWNPTTSEIGLSEFVIQKDSIVIVNSIQSTNDYLLKKNTKRNSTGR